MMYNPLYIQYLVHFHTDRDYFECHELLEEQWKQDERGQRQLHLVGLIQLAVALYHQRRGNWGGAGKMCQNAVTIFQTERKNLEELGIDTPALITLTSGRVEDIKNKRSYTSISIPLHDDSLLEQCLTYCQERGLAWGTESNLLDRNIIDKHLLRDRTEVVQERQEQLTRRIRVRDN